MKKVILALSLLLVLVIEFQVVNRITNREKEYRALGESAVMALYDFGSVYDLDRNMYDLKQITTDAVFSQLTIDNEQRSLNTYLKFKDSSVSVKILRSGSDYVMYSLDTESIDTDRVFVFFFTVDDDGKINSVREMECYDFIDNAS